MIGGALCGAVGLGSLSDTCKVVVDFPWKEWFKMFVWCDSEKLILVQNDLQSNLTILEHNLIHGNLFALKQWCVGPHQQVTNYVHGPIWCVITLFSWEPICCVAQCDRNWHVVLHHPSTLIINVE